MKNLLKKPVHKALGLSVAMALGSMAVSTVNAAPSMNNIGDMAIVPYYTVKSGYVSGIHITNTSDQTQIVKVRYNRADDSREVLDFIVMMSPHDMFTGYIKPNGDGIEFVPTDQSCVAPWLDANDDNVRDPMVSGQRVDANGDLIVGGGSGGASSQTGYISVIAMGAANAAQQISKDVLHANGVPSNCLRAASNFYAVRTPANPAVVKNALGVNVAINPAVDFATDPTLLVSSTTGALVPNTENDTGVVTFTDTVSVLVAETDTSPAVHAISNYGDSENPLVVSYFIRNTTNGVEFGNSAEHFENFAIAPMMANQEYGKRNLTQPRRQRDTGYEFPNLNGGSSYNGAAVGLIEAVNAGWATTAISNDWATSTAARGISTDWVVTLPGQNLQRGGTGAKHSVSFAAWNREEGKGDLLSGLVVSPGAPSSAASSTKLKGEVTVVTWDNLTSDTTLAGTALGDSSGQVLNISLSDAAYQSVNGRAAGWAKMYLGSTSATGNFTAATGSTDNLDLAEGQNAWIANAAVNPIAVVGFAAWARKFADNPGASYGRIIQHTRYNAQ